MSKIKFSIIVPVYNVEQYIAECIESVLNQTYGNYELILVDDGTPDKSGVICDLYAERDSRITVYHKNNKGLIHTRRYGIEKASGDYYVFLDSDDMLKQNALEILAEKINKYKCDCVIYGYEKIQEGIVIAQAFDKDEVYLTNKTEIYRKCFFELDKNGIVRKAVKSDVFKGLDYSPYYHIRLAEDLLQSLEIYKYSKSIAFISDILYEYRMNPQSMTHKKNITDIDSTVRKKVLEFLQKENAFTTDDFNRYRDFCINLVINQIIGIACSSESNDEKKQLLRQMREDSYYQSFLKEGITDRKTIGFRSIIFDLFKYKMDYLLIILINLEKQLKGTKVDN